MERNRTCSRRRYCLLHQWYAFFFVYSIDYFFSNTTDIETQFANLKHVLNYDKHFHVGLISRKKFMYFNHNRLMNYSDYRIPRVEQIIIPENTLKMTLATCTASMSTCITSIDRFAL